MAERRDSEEPNESVDDVVGRLKQEISDLVNTHMQLGRVEIMGDLQHIQRGGGMRRGARITGLAALLLASVAVALGVGQVLALWVGFLAVAALWGVAAVVLAWAARREDSRVRPIGEGARAELERDREWLRRRSG